MSAPEPLQAKPAYAAPAPSDPRSLLASCVAAAARGAELLRVRHPTTRIVGEEGTPDAAANLSGLSFVIDPLDGTTNFLHGYPWYAVSIAAVVDGAPVAGAVLNAATGELFTAT